MGKLTTLPKTKLFCGFFVHYPSQVECMMIPTATGCKLSFPFLIMHITLILQIIPVVSYYFSCCYCFLFVCLFVSFFKANHSPSDKKTVTWMQVDNTVCPVYRWLEYGLVLSIYKSLRTCCGLATIGQLWNRKSHPVDQQVYVCGCDYTEEPRIRSKCTIQLLAKSIAITCIVMLNVC